MSARPFDGWQKLRAEKFLVFSPLSLSVSLLLAPAERQVRSPPSPQQLCRAALVKVGATHGWFVGFGYLAKISWTRAEGAIAFGLSSTAKSWETSIHPSTFMVIHPSCNLCIAYLSHLNSLAALSLLDGVIFGKGLSCKPEITFLMTGHSSQECQNAALSVNIPMSKRRIVAKHHRI